MGAIRRTLRNLIAWAVVESDGSAGGSVPVQQIRAFDQSGRSIEWYPFGFFASARAGSPALRFLISEQAGALAHIPGSPTEAPAHSAGEVGVYHPDSGSFVIFRADGSVEVLTKRDLRATVGGAADLAVDGALTASAASATVTAATTTLVGDAVVTGDLTVQGDTILGSNVTSAGKDISDSHKHPTVDGLGTGNTGVPV